MVATMARTTDEHCWLCARPLGLAVELHHPLPKSQGGRETVAVHPICHRTLHRTFTNKALSKISLGDIRKDPRIERFLSWISSKPPDFHAPTRARR
jgi:hypothetical protein